MAKKNKDYKFYYGIPHCHTSNSTGKGSIKDAVKCAKSYNLDFIIITDHINYLRNKDNAKWHSIKKKIRSYSKKNHRFLILYGYEISVNHIGHINVINASELIEKKKVNLRKLFQYLKNSKNTVGAFNHPDRSIKRCEYNCEYNKLIRLIEVGNGTKFSKYKRYEDCYYNLLDNGWKLGAINSQDNHKTDWGKSDNLTVVISKSLKKKYIISALRDRRTYSTESRTLKLIVKANNEWMGSSINIIKGEKIHFHIEAYDKEKEIKFIQIISNKGVVCNQKNFNNANNAVWNLDLCWSTENTWYVVKVMHSDGRIALSSPVFVEAQF